VVWPQNHSDSFCLFSLKTGGDGFWRFGLKTCCATVFSSLTSKLVAMVSPSLVTKPAVGFLVKPQNQGGAGFPSLGLKTDNFGLVIWVSKSL
jgi:hypothetical protein